MLSDIVVLIQECYLEASVSQLSTRFVPIKTTQSTTRIFWATFWSSNQTVLSSTSF